MRTHLRKFLQRRHHVQRRCVAIGVLALRQRPRLLALGAAGQIGEQLEQAVRCGRQRHVVDQHLAQRLAAHRSGVRGAKQRDDLVDEAEIILGEDAEGIANDIVETACIEIEVDMPGLLFRSFLVEEASRHESCRHWIFARTAGFGDNRRRGRFLVRRRRGRLRRRGRRLAELLVQRLQHPRGLLAAGDAEIEPRFALVRDRVRIVAAIIAALTAILLRHGRHHPSPHRSAFGQLHAICDRHGLVVPGRFAIVAVARRSQHRPILLRRQRRGAVEAEHTDQEAVQPLSLLVAERSVRRNDFHPRRGRDLVHADASASASLRRASPS